jgi:hypothetical protein
LPLQVIAWIAGVHVCVAGALDLIAEWDRDFAMIQLILVVLAPIAFMLPRRAVRVAPESPDNHGAFDWLVCLILGAASFGVNAWFGGGLNELPPAYHDEFSYLFEAKTLLNGRFSYPSDPVHPELFDQMHVLNEGRMASRYYPGASLWLAPFVAIGKPYYAPRVAGALATILLYWIGRELSGRTAGLIAALALALSPGVAVFGNTLLAHHATLLSLSVFLWGCLRWRRTRTAGDAWIAGCGLAFAMICRPMTAAAVGLPFGVDVAVWLCSRLLKRMGEGNESGSPLAAIAGFGVPLILGGVLMASYNQSVTGDWRTSPYQLYTDIYTPRHVYGFDNVTRGERHLGSKVIDAYDRWAENLTVPLAMRNAVIRWTCSWVWSFDPLPLLLGAVILMGLLPWLDRRWLLVLLSIVSLHLSHIPYWYVGIMGWHYVFESAPLWCLVLGGASHYLLSDWNRRGAVALPWWWGLVLTSSLLAIYVPPKSIPFMERTPENPGDRSRVMKGIGSLAYPRHRHAELKKWLDEQIDTRPALVLVEQLETEQSHLDLVVNDPGLSSPVLLGRYRPGKTDVQQIRRDYPDRQVYIACPERHTIQPLRGLLPSK